MNLPDYAQRLREAREKAGKSIEQMAVLLEISKASYYDLEAYDDEIMTCVSLLQVALLCRALNIEPREFFVGERIEPKEPVTLNYLVDKIKEHITANQLELSVFEDSVGWEIEPLLQKPAKALEYDIGAIKDICDKIGIDWRSVLLGVISQNQ